jgi:hypothetical protein
MNQSLDFNTRDLDTTYDNNNYKEEDALKITLRSRNIDEDAYLNKEKSLREKDTRTVRSL